MHYPRRHFLAGAVALPGLTLADFANAGAAEADPFVPAFEEFRALWIAHAGLPIDVDDATGDAACHAAWDALGRLAEVQPTSLKGIALAMRAMLATGSDNLVEGAPADPMALRPEHTEVTSGYTGEIADNALMWAVIRAAEALEQRSI
ncbi:MAG: hypothetical protein VXW57_09155 [Pseudomonadota bacterium]|nr:hypothetical protein [Pseudomonadota bacterium]